MVARPNGRSLSVSQGKGVDLVAAKVSGLMEAAEAWHAENVVLPLRLASLSELAALAPVVDPARLARPLHSRFQPDEPILWIEGTDLIGGGRLWLPFECVHLDYRVPGPQGSGCFLANGTGLAAGNHLLEAVCHALCEVVERDAFALWSERPTAERAARRLDPGTIDEPVCRGLLDAYEAAGVAVAVDDLTTDVGVPVFSATVVDRRVESVRRIPAARGGGCHPDRGIALARALTEAAQSRLTAIAGCRDDATPEAHERARDPAAIAGHLARVERPGPRVFAGTAHVPGESVDDDVAHLLDRVRDAGVEQAILVDLTRPDLRLPVVRMVVPGLEGWSERGASVAAGPRRLAVRAGT